MKGAYIMLFVVAVVLGGFVGWGIAAATGKDNKTQSTYTGRGSGAGAAVGVVACVALALVSTGKKGDVQDE